jgi:hypothetical protein
MFDWQVVYGNTLEHIETILEPCLKVTSGRCAAGNHRRGSGLARMSLAFRGMPRPGRRLDSSVVILMDQMGPDGTRPAQVVSSRWTTLLMRATLTPTVVA